MSQYIIIDKNEKNPPWANFDKSSKPNEIWIVHASMCDLKAGLCVTEVAPCDYNVGPLYREDVCTQHFKTLLFWGNCSLLSSTDRRRIFPQAIHFYWIGYSWDFCNTAGAQLPCRFLSGQESWPRKAATTLHLYLWRKCSNKKQHSRIDGTVHGAELCQRGRAAVLLRPGARKGF